MAVLRDAAPAAQVPKQEQFINVRNPSRILTMKPVKGAHNPSLNKFAAGNADKVLAEVFVLIHNPPSEDGLLSMFRTDFDKRTGDK